MRAIIILFLVFIFQLTFAQEKFENIQVQTLSGIEIPLKSVLKQKKDKPLILFTWSKKWCYPCVRVLDKFDNYYYEKLKKDYNLKFVALNLDTETEGDEIKKYIVDKGWYFDIYQDPEKNYMTAMNVSSAPQIYLIINGKIVEYKKGFVDKISNAEITADYMNLMVKSIENKKIFYDENWDFSDEENAMFVRYVDYLNGLYEVQDRWVSGELQMRGVYTDKWLTEQNGDFVWYHKNGEKETKSTFLNGTINGFSYQWYENGQLWIKEEYKNGHLYNILELYSKTGEALTKGKFLNGNGYIYRYDENAKKLNRRELENGVLHGEYIKYDENGRMESKHIFNKGNYVKKIE